MAVPPNRGFLARRDDLMWRTHSCVQRSHSCERGLSTELGVDTSVDTARTSACATTAHESLSKSLRRSRAVPPYLNNLQHEVAQTLAKLVAIAVGRSVRVWWELCGGVRFRDWVRFALLMIG